MRLEAKRQSSNHATMCSDVGNNNRGEDERQGCGARRGSEGGREEGFFPSGSFMIGSSICADIVEVS